MAFDEELADRLREIVQDEAGLSEQRMFGGLAFLINGNMAVLINGNMTVSASGQGGLLLRVPPEQTDDLVAEAHAERASMRGREMDGWLRVDPAGLTSDDVLARWVTRGVTYARSLPPKR